MSHPKAHIVKSSLQYVEPSQVQDKVPMKQHITKKLETIDAQIPQDLSSHLAKKLSGCTPPMPLYPSHRHLLAFLATIDRPPSLAFLPGFRRPSASLDAVTRLLACMPLPAF
jgi:hypothetical protein